VTGLARMAIVAGAILGGLSVAGGAFGAHGLKAVLEASGQAANWETSARYAMVHALALVAVGLLAAVRPEAPGLALAAWCFLAGTLIFSGCLAALALTGVKLLGAIVPIGGVLLIAGWARLALTAARLP
jgi:uncharacterized membrane protein YgdD (TMEM256/DUF423 family)